MIARGSMLAAGRQRTKSLGRTFGRPKKDQQVEASVAKTQNHKMVPETEAKQPQVLLPEVRDLAKALEKRFQAEADSDKAAGMKKYMRDQFDYYGLSMPQRTTAFLEVFAKRALDKSTLNREFLEQFAEVCMQSKYREMHYSFISAMNSKAAENSRVEEILPVLEKFNIFGQWWDITDSLASIFGAIFLKDAKLHARKNQEYIQHDNLWMRRIALIHQLKYKDKTNQEMLWDNINRTKHEKEFFIRKAIGWALREYSKTNPQAVRKFIEGPDGKGLSPLSVREGMKVIHKKKH